MFSCQADSPRDSPTRRLAASGAPIDSSAFREQLTRIVAFSCFHILASFSSIHQHYSVTITVVTVD